MRWNQKRREQASQYSLPYVHSSLHRSEMFMELYREEKREEGDRGGQEDKEEIKRRETDPASNQFPKCSPPSGTHKEIHRVG